MSTLVTHQTKNTQYGSPAVGSQTGAYFSRAIASLKAWAKAMKRDVLALWLAARDPRTPLHVKIIAAAIAAYALSPIDLIPDFIPVLGYLDDLLIVPLGIMLVIWMLPVNILSDARAKAVALANRPVSRTGAAFIIAIWFIAAALTLWLILK